MALKRNETASSGPTQQLNGDDHAEFEFRENPRINAQIDGYKKQFPKKWAFIKSMPRERLENSLVLAKIRSFEQRERLDRGVLRKVENNEAFKKDCETLLKHFPADQREKAKVALAKQYVFSQSREQRSEQKHGVAMAA